MIRTPTQWWALLAQSPSDWDLRLVFADWLEDHDEPELAQGQRWQVEHRRRPERIQPGNGLAWCWFLGTPGVPRLAHLDSELFETLVQLHLGRYGVVWLDFFILEEAERGLAQALSQLQAS